MIINYIRYIFDSFGWAAPLIELLMIGFAVYSVMSFLRGTGGEKLFMGLIFLLLGYWAISFLTQRLRLERIDLLFRSFLVMVLIVAAVAFQPELRRGLMRLGGTTFSRTTPPEIVNVVEQIVDAVATMSRSEIGALIALERKVGLGDLVASGVTLDAVVSAPTLNTIFWPGSPLHDLGVVIQQGKLAAAGVQFPLAEYGEYDRQLGSRHRAAIGMSKETDAVVVVVSEETGNIGLAVDGKLTRFLTLEQLRQQLLDIMLPPGKNQKKHANNIQSDQKDKGSP